MIADDLFAGAGGWDLAAEALGIHARGVENMPAARATRDAAGLTTIHDDVWTYEPDGTAAGLIASPPCQTFSAAGKGTGRKALDDVLGAIRRNEWSTIAKLRALGERVGDQRTALVLTPLHFAMHPGYEWLAWEQVKEVLPVWEACADKLRAYGWNVWTGKVYAEQYGVPQTRIRAVLLASRTQPVDRPTPTHSRYYSRSPEKLDAGVEKWVSMAEALGWGMTARPSMTVTGGGSSTGGAEPFGNAARQGILRELEAGRWALGTTNVRDGVYQSRSIDEPAPTITGATRSFRWGAPPLRVETPGVKGGNMQERRVTGDEQPDWVLRNNNTANAAVRSIDQPAPTLYFGQRCNYVAWEPTPALPGDTAADCAWVHDRPSPTVVGTFAPDVVAAPGYRKPGDPPRQKTPGSVRITVEEAAVLQSFPADFPFNGGPKDSKGKKFLQVGNAVPPLMGLHALAAATGLPVPQPVTAEEAVA